MKPTSKNSEIMQLWGCAENPLAYMIEPKGSVEIVGKDHKTKKEDLKNIL